MVGVAAGTPPRDASVGCGVLRALRAIGYLTLAITVLVVGNSVAMSIRERTVAIHRKFLERVAELIEEGVRSGQFRDVDPMAAAIIFKALEKKREERYPSAEVMAQDLRRYLDGEGTIASYLAS